MKNINIPYYPDYKFTENNEDDNTKFTIQTVVRIKRETVWYDVLVGKSFIFPQWTGYTREIHLHKFFREFFKEVYVTQKLYRINSLVNTNGKPFNPISPIQISETERLEQIHKL